MHKNKICYYIALVSVVAILINTMIDKIINVNELIDSNDKLRREKSELSRELAAEKESHQSDLEYAEKELDEVMMRYLEVVYEYEELKKLKDPCPESYNYVMDERDLDALLRCVQAEAGPTNYESQKIITKVILNRVASPYFPDTIYEVIYQGNGSQFSVAGNGAMEAQVITEETRRNVMEVLILGCDIPDTVQFFYSSRIKGNGNWVTTLDVYDEVEGTVFAHTNKSR